MFGGSVYSEGFCGLIFIFYSGHMIDYGKLMCCMVLSFIGA
jgi:hypothetical protein